MKKTAILATFMLCAVLLHAQRIDTQQSEVKFEISNMKWRTAKGTFSGMNGKIIFKENDLNSSSFDVCIDPATVKTGSEKMEKHLKNEDFFNVKVYPEICFKSISIEKSASGYKTIGMLSMHGISEEVEITFSYKNKMFTGDLVVNRFDFKIGEDTNTFMIGKEAKLKIICILQ